MKLQHITTIAALAVSTVAKPHQLMHRHVLGHAKRGPRPDNVAYVPAATVTSIIYWLDGYSISEEEVRQGIANGTLLWGDDGVLSTSTNGPIALPTVPPAPEAQTQTSIGKPRPISENPVSSAAPPQADSSAAPPSPSTPEAETVTSSAASKPSSNPSPAQQDDTSSALIDKNGYCASCDKEFPNGKIPCNEFPFGYGALPITHEGLGGWSGIQDPNYSGGDGYDDITTVRKGSCSDGSCCTAGSFCSYGCPNPYLKLSFPNKQGRTGQSVGGLYCNKNGYLEMADGSLGKTLCGQGSKRMTVKVQNKLSKSVSICRTDYPGTESMTFPLTLGPGETGFLANPDTSRYYFWQGKATSAQYYVNKQGVPESEACTWGEPDKGKGNWSPTILGTSYDDQKADMGYTSIFQNQLSENERLDYDITFTGDGVSSPCKYKSATSQYCRGNICGNNINEGCTAAVNAGSTLTIVLSDG